MISPPKRGQPYPGRLPPVYEQWRRLNFTLRTALIVGPVIVIAALFAANLTVGVTSAVFIGGVAAATVVFAKNRSDRHNAAVDRGEIAVAPDPRIRSAGPDELSDAAWELLGRLAFERADVGSVQRFEGGWLVRRCNRRDVAAIVGDDGGCAQFDPGKVTDLWAVTEYLAGRGHESFAEDL